MLDVGGWGLVRCRSKVVRNEKGWACSCVAWDGLQASLYPATHPPTYRLFFTPTVISLDRQQHHLASLSRPTSCDKSHSRSRWLQCSPIFRVPKVAVRQPTALGPRPHNAETQTSPLVAQFHAARAGARAVKAGFYTAVDQHPFVAVARIALSRAALARDPDLPRWHVGGRFLSPLFFSA